MARFTSRVFLVVSVVCLSVADNAQKTNRASSTQKSASCWDTALTQVEMNDCAAQEFKKSDDELNRLYPKLLAKYEQDQVVVDKIKAVHRAWVTYRDAQIDSWYPEIDQRFYGSVRPMCQALLLARLTEERAKLLSEMLNPTEGDVCGFGPSEPK